MDSAIFNLTHGLYVLTARVADKDNGCIVDAVMQATALPQQVVVGVQKRNLTNGMIQATGLFNLSILTTEAPAKVFQHFGMQSGRDVNKFEKCDAVQRTANGIYYIPKFTNAYLCCKVERTIDTETHTLFLAIVTESRVLSDLPGLTYNDYRARLKQ